MFIKNLYSLKTIKRSITVRSPINVIKFNELKQFLTDYSECLQYSIDRLWSRKSDSKRFIEYYKEPLVKQRFNKLTTRLLQCAGKQASGIIRVHVETEHKGKPDVRNLVAVLDQRFVTFQPEFNSFHWLRIHSGNYEFFVPYKHNEKLFNKFPNNGYALKKTIRLRIVRDELFIDFIFEKPTQILKTEGKTIDIDLGYVNLTTCSDGTMVGKRMNDVIKTLNKRKKNTHETITNYSYSELKKINYNEIKMIVIENLHSGKHGKRGMFPRKHNRRLSHWQYAKVRTWLEQRCEETGIRLRVVSPAYTSQYCRKCNKWDRRNRRGEKFKCIHCRYETHADYNASLNLELLGLAGVYSLRLLQKLIISGQMNICL